MGVVGSGRRGDIQAGPQGDRATLATFFGWWSLGNKRLVCCMRKPAGVWPAAGPLHCEWPARLETSTERIIKGNVAVPLYRCTAVPPRLPNFP